MSSRHQGRGGLTKPAVAEFISACCHGPRFSPSDTPQALACSGPRSSEAAWILDPGSHRLILCFINRKPRPREKKSHGNSEMGRGLKPRSDSQPGAHGLWGSQRLGPRHPPTCEEKRVPAPGAPETLGGQPHRGGCARGGGNTAPGLGRGPAGSETWGLMRIKAQRDERTSGYQDPLGPQPLQCS